MSTPRGELASMSFNTRTPINDEKRMHGLLEEVGPYGGAPGSWRAENGPDQKRHADSAQHTQRPALVERSKMSSPLWGEDASTVPAPMNFPTATKPKSFSRLGAPGEVRRTRAQLKTSNFTDEMKELLRKSHNLLLNDDAGTKGDAQKRLKKSPLRIPRAVKPSKSKPSPAVPAPDEDAEMKEPVAFAEMNWNSTSKRNSAITSKEPTDDSHMSEDTHCPLSPESSDPVQLRVQRQATAGVSIAPLETPDPFLLQVPPLPTMSRRGSADTTGTEGSIQWATDTDISFSETEDEGEQNIAPTSKNSNLDRSNTVIARNNTVRQRGGGHSNSSGSGNVSNHNTSRHPVENNYRISRTHRRGSSGGPPGSGDDDDPNDDRRKRQRKDDDRHRRGSESEPGRRFACPYYRFDPTHPDHMRCKDKSFPTLARVKGHVLRSHLKPRQCERCCNFRAGDRGQISNHLKGGNCEKAEFVPMDPEVERKGNELSRAGCSKTWEQVCMVLFDCDLDDVPPAYFEDPAQQTIPSKPMNSNIAIGAEDPLLSLATSQIFQTMVQEHLTVVLGRVLPAILAEEMPHLIARYRELEANHHQQQKQHPEQFAASHDQLTSPGNNPHGKIPAFDANSFLTGFLSAQPARAAQSSISTPSPYFQYPSPTSSAAPASSAPTPASAPSANVSFGDPFHNHHNTNFEHQPNTYFTQHHSAPAVTQTVSVPPPPAAHPAASSPQTAEVSPSPSDIDAWINNYELVNFNGGDILTGSEDGRDSDEMFWTAGNMGLDGMN